VPRRRWWQPRAWARKVGRIRILEVSSAVSDETVIAWHRPRLSLVLDVEKPGTGPASMTTEVCDLIREYPQQIRSGVRYEFMGNRGHRWPWRSRAAPVRRVVLRLPARGPNQLSDHRPAVARPVRPAPESHLATSRANDRLRWPHPTRDDFRVATDVKGSRAVVRTSRPVSRNASARILLRFSGHRSRGRNRVLLR
jgi:hypothetical protein